MMQNANRFVIRVKSNYIHGPLLTTVDFTFFFYSRFFQIFQIFKKNPKFTLKSNQLNNTPYFISLNIYILNSF
jgi:hypothetical protein